MREDDYISALFKATPDKDHYSQRSKIIFESPRDISIYIRGDEHIEEDGSYIHIWADTGDVYLSRVMIERLVNFVRGGHDYIDP